MRLERPRNKKTTGWWSRYRLSSSYGNKIPLAWFFFIPFFFPLDSTFPDERRNQLMDGFRPVGCITPPSWLLMCNSPVFIPNRLLGRVFHSWLPDTFLITATGGWMAAKLHIYRAGHLLLSNKFFLFFFFLRAVLRGKWWCGLMSRGFIPCHSQPNKTSLFFISMIVVGPKNSGRFEPTVPGKKKIKTNVTDHSRAG